MSTTMASNGRPQRKQLSDQLDRLDGIIDCLADGLNKAVADAAREGSREAVKEILTELLTNPDVLSMIRVAVGSMIPTPPTPSTTAPPTHEPVAKPRGMIATAATTVVKRVKTAGTSLVRSVRDVCRTVAGAASAVRHSPRLKKTVLIGAAVGLATAVVATTNHTVAAALSGIGAAATTVAVQIGGWFRGARLRLGLA
jgi:hypothetical protein